jgi:aspartate aminotransferase-like enzyme
MIDARGPEFARVLERCTVLLRSLFQTQNDVLVFPGVGTGGLESAVVNTLSPGDPVLIATCGVFGDRFARLAEAFGVDVRRLSTPRGRAIEPEQLQQALEENSDVVAVLLTHTESSTGIANPLEDLAPLVRECGHLLIVDAVSALGAVPVRTDELGFDVVVGGSQRAWHMEPGLVMLSVSERAWQASKRARLPRFYWDWRHPKGAPERFLAPYMPALRLFYPLENGLREIHDEGLPRVWERHRRLGDFVRAGITERGLQLFADPAYASNTITTFKVPDGLEAGALRERLAEAHGVLLGEGQAELAGRVLRIAHVGYTTEDEIRETLDAIQMAIEAELAEART